MKRFLSALVFCAALYPASAQVTTTDSLALVSLYNSTNGGAWTNRTNWLQPALVGSWYGITVSGGRVTEINLPTNNLTGTLPNLSELTALTRLDIQNNLIGNPIPATLDSLTSLQHLNLRNNRFTGLIPNLSSLSNLKYFSVGLNNFLQFLQPIPAFVVGLTQLEYLGLDNSRFGGTIPTGFSNLTQLKELTVAGASPLTPSIGFIGELATIQALERITLQNLNLGGFSINLAPLGGLTNLELLDIRSTNTNTLPPPSVWVSDSLTIDISSNALDFGDLEPLQGITQPAFVNTGQALLLFSAINPGTVTLVEGDPFTLQTFFGGTQNNYVWQKGGVPIPGQTGTTLDLDSIEASEAGVYRLQMTNNIVTGLTLTTTNITLNVTPRVQSRFAIQQNSILTQEIGASSYGGYWADMDRDGDEDLFVNNAFDTNPNFLYQNNADGTFTKVTTGDITTLRDPSRYASWGDYDNDGYLDMFVGDYANGDDISSLYQNNGNGTFNRIPFNHKSDGGLWADYDNDGDLDLSVMVTSALPVSNKLYKNNGGTFEVIENFVPFTSTWVAGWVDMDNDGDLDYFLTDANLNPSNIRLFRNDQGVFTASTVPLPTGNFSVRALSWADIDGDGDQDFFAENINGNITSTAESQFYINDGTGQFTRENASLRTGGLRLAGARGTVFGDADNDGDLDLFVNHKHLTTSNDVIVQLLLNNGSGSFTVVPVAEQSFGVSDFGTNMSMADYNNDGFLDLFIANFDILIPNRLCRNLQSGNGNHWIKLNLEGTVSNKSAIGARVDIYSGGNRRTRQVLSSSGLSGQNSLLVHSGLASATQADSVHIWWPSGFLTRRFNLAADQTHSIQETTDLPPPTVVTADSLALVNFYNELNGPSWTNKTNWLTGKVNTWYGITVDSGKRVSSISLPNNLLRGKVPDSFSSLSALKTIHLQQNSVEELPTNFNSLTALTYVNLNSTPLNSLPPLSGLVQLDSLIVTNCRLTFEDLEPVASIPGIRYIPQTGLGSLGSSNILVGGPFTLSQPFGGSANQYQWSKDAATIPGANTDTYTIVAVSAADAGTYSLQITSPLVPGLTFSTLGTLAVISPGAQTYFSWPNSGGISLDAGADSYGGYWVDIDNDGDDDLAVNNLNTGGDPRSVDLYENINGSFTRLTSANMPVGDSPRNLTWADSDNDGDLDFYLGDVGFGTLSDGRGAFYRNNGNKTFTRIDLNQNADGGAWIDYNNDGRIDLFTVDSGQPTSVFRNDSTTFTLVPGIFTQGSDWTLSFADIDNDRDMDLVQLGKSPNTGFNNLYRNDSLGVYTYLSSSIISTDSLVSARGGSWADIDNDGDMDFFAMNANTGGTVQSAFYFNDGSGSFAKQNSTSILGTDVRGRASSFGDVDNDGDIDLIISNGKAGNTGTNLYFNNGNGTFSQATDSVQSFIPVSAATLAQISLGDANSDGFLDIFAATFSAGQPATIYRNNTNGNNWIKYRLQGVQSNRSAVGARIEIKGGGARQIREVTSQTGLASQNSLVQHFGIGISSQVDTTKIYWPSGAVQMVINLPGNLVHTIIEGVNPPTNSVIISDSLALVAMYTSMNGVNWINKTNWLTGKVNAWYGITVSNLRVTGISLPSNQVSGTMPASFTTLTGLTSLNLSGSSLGLNGILPADFSNLSALRYLNLGGCSITRLSQLSGLTNLDSLIVTNNNLTFEDLEPFISIPGFQYIPQNLIGPGSTSNIVSGNPWNMSINVGGSANQYQWLKAGVPTGVTVSTYSIPSVSGTDAGSYQLTITSSLVPGLTLSTQPHLMAVVTPGPQTYFSWPQNDGIINDTPSDSYGGYWADIDNDGDDDLAINNLQSATTGRSVDLYENTNGVFTRLLNAGMPTDESTRNVTWADYDNDGDPDFYLGDIGFNLLSDFKGAFYRNNGDKTFTRAVLDHLSDGGTWEDYDKDGQVDLFIMDAGQPTRVFRNLGDGNFALAPVTFSLGSDWTLAFADIDNDRDMDLAQLGKAQNSGFNNLYRNDSIGIYTYLSSSIISTDNLLSTRGGSWADIDNDNDMDFFAMASFTGGTVQSAFYVNDGTGNFTKQESTTVLGADVRGRSSSFGDLDNDGDVDLVVHNGRAGNLGVNVYLNNGGGTFTQIPSSAQTFIPIASPTFSQVSLGDANSDGFLDILSTTFSAGQPAALYQNVGNGNKWVKFHLTGVQSNRSGIGARIEIKAGGSRQIREVTAQTGLASQNSLVQHFGLDSAALVDSVKIYWPSGIVQYLSNVASNQTLTVVEDSTTLQLEQTITFDELPEKALGDAPFALTATASSGLPVSYTSSNPSVAYIQSDTVFIVAAGSTIITARQPGNSVYSAADSVSHLLTVIDNTIRPTVPSTNLVFTNVFSTKMNVSFTPGNGERHLVAMRAGAPVTWVPVDGTTYNGRTDFANAFDTGDGTRIISADDTTSIAVTELPPSTVMHVRVFEFNGTNYTKYLVSSTLSGSRTTLALPNVFVTAPANNSVNQNVTLNVTSSNMVGATTYTIELDTVPYFAAPLMRTGARTQNFTGLGYGKLYYSRVKTDLSPDYGPLRSFSTAPAEFFSYVISPANNATGVTLTNLSRSVTMNNVIGATTYTCELNTTSNFDGISQVKTGARTQTFTGLSPGTTYYSRVHTDLSPNTWGPTRQFSTAGASLLTWVSSPANNAVNVSYQPNVTVTNVGATSYTVQLSPTSDFTVNVLEQTSPTRTMSFTGLAYNTQYYSRARTELDSAWGPLRSFTTTSPLAYSYMTSPANNAVNVNYVVNISANTVPGATTYFIEANTLPDFSGTSIVRSGARTQNFTLAPNQLYYVRVSTDLLPGQYGVIRSFTTISSLAFSYITSPANGATNVPYVTNITAYNVPLATSFIIEANTLPDFTGTSIVKMGTVRTYSFTLAHDQVYYVRVQTNLAPGEWGLYRSFTTGSPQSLAYVTSPANGVVGVPTTVNVTSNLVPGATSYTIELNPEEFFTGIPIIRTGAGRTKNFTGLSENRTYYARVSTSLTPGVWGPTRSFTTVNPGGRQAGEVWVESTDEDPLVPDEITEVTIFPNPFTDQFDIHVQTTDQQPLEAQLLDMNGRTVFEARDWMTNRLHTVKGEFSPGIYLLELNTEGTRRVMRVVRR